MSKNESYVLVNKYAFASCTNYIGIRIFLSGMNTEPKILPQIGHAASQVGRHRGNATYGGEKSLHLIMHKIEVASVRSVAEGPKERFAKHI